MKIQFRNNRLKQAIQINKISQLRLSVELLSNQLHIQEQEKHKLETENNELKLNQQNQVENIGTLLNKMESPRSEQNSQNNEEIEQMQNMILDLQQEDEANKKKIEKLNSEVKQLKQQLQQLNQLNQEFQLDIEQKNIEINEEQAKVSSLEEELVTYEQKFADVVQNKQKLSTEYQLAQQTLQQFDLLQQDNVQLQLLLNSKTEELEEFKMHNKFETQYLELKEDFDQFKEYVQAQLLQKDEALAEQSQQLIDYELCKEQLIMFNQQCQLLQEQLNKQTENNEQLQDQYQNSLLQIQQINNNNLQFQDIQSQNSFLKQEIETVKSDNISKQEIIADLETQLKIQQQLEEESPLKLQKLQSEYSENRSEYLNHKEQCQREIHQYKQEKTIFQSDIQNMKEMINAFVSQNKQYQPQGKTAEEYYEKLVDFVSDDKFVHQQEEQILLKQQLELYQNKVFVDGQCQMKPEVNDQESITNQIEIFDKSTQSEQVDSSLSGSMWLNNDINNSKDDQYQQMKKKNEDLDQLLKNYEKEVSSLKQQNKLLQKKIDSNQKSNPQERLGKRVSLFEQTQPRKSKQIHLNLCESQQIDDQQREYLFMKELIENLKKDVKQRSQQNDDLMNEIKQIQEKHQEEQYRLEEQLQSQILINQTRNKSVDINQTIISQVNTTMIQLNQIELFLVVKSQKNFSFPYIEFNRKQIKFYSQGKTRIEKQIYETFTFDDVFLDIQKVRQYFQFYGKISLDQSRMFLIVGQSKTQKKFLLLMFLDEYYNSIKEQKFKLNYKLRLQIQYSERIGNNWSILDQLSKDLHIDNENLNSSLQQLDLIIQHIKFYLYGKNQQTKTLGKEKIRQLIITYSIVFKDQTYTQQFIITTIPVVPRCQFPKFLKKIFNHTPSLQFKYYCLLTINPILLHYNQTVDIMYLAKMVYAQNNQEDLNKQMKIDDESVRQVRQANGQVIIKNQEIDILKKQIEHFKKQYNDMLQKQENKQQLFQQIQFQLQNVIVDIKLKMSQSKTNKNSKIPCPEAQFYDKLIAQLENLTRKLSPIQQVLNTDRSISPSMQNY
ncbi:unnamed protein product (macronuclear) [Paramecium tetraurelia]|uniref:Kinesin motor domain-containing protein n=1 Tax=Paramecium tetraurelia TaxID=5888 RepID=A0D9G4_PARTE|nr:uncharacterized protein GSPATT00014611001 [Paramecium tetraurelia]CAK79681.1 unnamed protein product [Paramecium tetraurelia]|eukprot:XP_001447078.1 hypothetical protein (macronuclear) [Paramecium tetraurelia strain d4-2]